MTASTEQERAEFEAYIKSTPEWLRGAPWLDRTDDGSYKNTNTVFLFGIWQASAARRAQVVPKGWKLVPEEPTPAMYDRVMREGYYHDDPKAVKAVLRAEYQDMLAAAPQPPSEQQAARRVQVVPQREPVEGDQLPPVGSRIFIRHGRDDDAHACIVTGYYVWGDLKGDKRLHRVFVRMVYEGTQTQNARMLCDCYKTEAEALAAAPQSPEAACNLSMQPELATEAAAEHKALRSVYEAARGLLRYEGVDDGRAITYRTKLASAIEEVKHIDSGLWEPPEAAKLDDIGVVDMAQAVDSTESAPVQLPPLPWQYRPDKYDDWGCIKDADGRVICYARDTTVLDEATLTKHRAAGTDPWREVAMFIANACNAAMDKRAALSAGPGIQKAVQALIDAAILEGGSPPPSQEAAMQATEQRKADLLKLLEPFIGTPLNE